MLKKVGGLWTDFVCWTLENVGWVLIPLGIYIAWIVAGPPLFKGVSFLVGSWGELWMPQGI